MRPRHSRDFHLDTFWHLICEYLWVWVKHRYPVQVMLCMTTVQTPTVIRTSTVVCIEPSKTKQKNFSSQSQGHTWIEEVWAYFYNESNDKTVIRCEVWCALSPLNRRNKIAVVRSDEEPFSNDGTTVHRRTHTCTKCQHFQQTKTGKIKWFVPVVSPFYESLFER